MATASSGKLTRRGGERRPPAGAASDVGVALREARERLGVTLAEVRDRTGVSWQHLEALEAMDLARLPDQRTVVTAARRYSEVVGLDPSEVCGTALRAWQDEHWKHDGAPVPEARRSGTGRSRRRQANQSSASEKLASIDMSAVSAGPGDTATQAHLRAFTQTAEVPMLGGNAARGSSATSLQFAETGALPITSRLYGGRRLPPRRLRLAVAITALLLVVGIAGLAVHHYKPQWLKEIHLTRGQSAAASATTAPSSPRSGSSGSTSPTRGARSSHSSTTTRSLVTTSALGTGSGAVLVHARGYEVIITAQRACWIDATVPSAASGPVFVGVLQPGDTKTLTPVQGQLSVEFGASGVSLAVVATGKSTPGWTFTPPSAPFTLGLATAPGS